MTPALAPTIALSVVYNHPGEHGRMPFLCAAIIETVLPNGDCSLTVFEHGRTSYVPEATRGNGPGQWTFPGAGT
jgi:hypothetical protein